MKKRVICSLLVAFVAASFILPALATELAGNEELPEAAQANSDAAAPAAGSAEVRADAIAETETGMESFVLLDGVPQPVEYEIRNGTTYVTVRSFVAMADPKAVVIVDNGVVTVSSSKVGQTVDAEGNTVDVVQETLSMTVSPQLPYIIANGRYLYAKGSITTVNGQVAAPIRKLAQVFNLDVDYDAEAQAALLTHVEGRSAYIQPGDSFYNADALYWLSRIIYTESGNQILEGKIAVGNVVMNRVNSPLFPNNIYDVLNQQNQFMPCSILSLYTPNSESVVAAKLVMEGVVVLPNALFFAQAGLVCYASVYRPYVTTIGGHAFYA